MSSQEQVPIPGLDGAYLIRAYQAAISSYRRHHGLAPEASSDAPPISTATSLQPAGELASSDRPPSQETRRTVLSQTPQPAPACAQPDHTDLARTGTPASAPGPADSLRQSLQAMAISPTGSRSKSPAPVSVATAEPLPAEASHATTLPAPKDSAAHSAQANGPLHPTCASPQMAGAQQPSTNKQPSRRRTHKQQQQQLKEEAQNATAAPVQLKGSTDLPQAQHTQQTALRNPSHYPWPYPHDWYAHTYYPYHSPYGYSYTYDNAQQYGYPCGGGYAPPPPPPLTPAAERAQAAAAGAAGTGDWYAAYQARHAAWHATEGGAQMRADTDTQSDKMDTSNEAHRVGGAQAPIAKTAAGAASHGAPHTSTAAETHEHTQGRSQALAGARAVSEASGRGSAYWFPPPPPPPPPPLPPFMLGPCGPMAWSGLAPGRCWQCGGCLACGAHVY